LVTGYWSLFYEEGDRDFNTPFSERVDMTPYFLENSLLVLVVLIPTTVLFLLLKAYHHKKTLSTTDVEEQNVQ
jgi:hypothetical protein